MENLYTKDSIRTFSGKYVNVFDVDLNSIDILDICHALSREQRFSNHLPVNYSVAQHSLICAELAPDEFKFDALCHDFSEFALRDLPKPVKNGLPQYEELENKLMKSLSLKFGFRFPLPSKIKEIDKIMLVKEWNALMLGEEKFEWDLLTQDEAKEQLLSKFNELKPF